MEDVFNQIDTDGSGFLEKGEIRNLADMCMTQQGYSQKPTEEMYEEVMNSLDINADGKVSKEEFFKFMKQLVEQIS